MSPINFKVVKWGGALLGFTVLLVILKTLGYVPGMIIAAFFMGFSLAFLTGVLASAYLIHVRRKEK